MYKIIKLNQTLPPNGVTVKPFFAPNDEKTLSMRFETYEKATNHMQQKIKILDMANYHIEEI